MANELPYESRRDWILKWLFRHPLSRPTDVAFINAYASTNNALVQHVFDKYRCLLLQEDVSQMQDEGYVSREKVTNDDWQRRKYHLPMWSNRYRVSAKGAIRLNELQLYEEQKLDP